MLISSNWSYIQAYTYGHCTIAQFARVRICVSYYFCLSELGELYNMYYKYSLRQLSLNWNLTFLTILGRVTVYGIMIMAIMLAKPNLCFKLD